MIDPKELRIGNLVQTGNEAVIIVNAITPEDFCTTNGDWVEWQYIFPIPISPEWINRFDTESSYKDTVKICEIWEDSSRIKIKYNYYGENEITIEQYGEGEHRLPHIKYVHQLQNLVFALTGTELTVKEPQTLDVKESQRLTGETGEWTPGYK